MGKIRSSPSTSTFQGQVTGMELPMNSCSSLATWVAGDSVSSMATTDLLLHKAKRKRLESFLAGRMS